MVTFLPSVTLTVAVYEDLVSKSGAVTNVNSPEFNPIAISLPETLYSRVTLPSKSTSVAETVPIAVSFSATVKLAPEEITGELSFSSVTVTVISCVATFVPSVALTVAVYEDLVSKSGAVTNVKTPPEVIASSVPEIVNVTV